MTDIVNKNEYIDLSKYVIHINRPMMDVEIDNGTKQTWVTILHPLEIVTVPDFYLNPYIGKNIRCITAISTFYIKNIRIVTTDGDTPTIFSKPIYTVEYDSVTFDENAISKVINAVAIGNIDHSKFQNEKE